MSRQERLFPVKDSLLVVHWVSSFLATTSVFSTAVSPLVYSVLFSCDSLPPPLRSLCRLVVKGYRTPLAAEDLWTLREEDTSCKIIAELQQDWTAECAKIQK